MPSGKPRISPGDLEILQILWISGPCGIKDVQAHLSVSSRHIAITTVATRMKRMEDKNLIASVDERRPRLFRAAVERSSTTTSLVHDVLTSMFNGSVSRMIVHLLAKRDISVEERQAVQDQLDKMK